MLAKSPSYQRPRLESSEGFGRSKALEDRLIKLIYKPNVLANKKKNLKPDIKNLDVKRFRVG